MPEGTTVGDISISIEAASEEAVRGLSNLSKALMSIKKAVKDVNLSDTAKELNKLKEAVSGLSGNAGENVSSLAKGITALGKVKAPENLASTIRSVVSALEPLDREKAGELRDLAEALRDLRDVRVKLPRTGGRGTRGSRKSSTASSGKGNTAEIVKDIEAYTGNNKIMKGLDTWSSRISKFSGETANALMAARTEMQKFGGTVKSVFTGITKMADRLSWFRPVQQLGNAVRNLGNQFRSLNRSIGRVVFYRAIRTAMKAISDGFREGTANLYQYSRIMGTDFAPAMDSLATSALYLKNSIGAMVAPLIEQIAPAVDMLIDKFVALFNVIGKTFAALSGKSSYSQAIKYPKEYAEATDEANKALKRFTIGIDELNIIGEKSGNAGAAAMDYGSMFEEVEVPQETKEWVIPIRLAIQEGEWEMAGALVAQHLGSMMDGIDFQSIGAGLSRKVNNALSFINSAIRNFPWQKSGENVAAMLNTVFSADGIDPYLLGETMAAKVQAAINFAYGFVQTFDFKRFGEWLGNVVNGWFGGIDWAKAGETLYLGISGVLDTAITFLDTVDFSQLGKAFLDFTSEIDFIELGRKIGEVIKKAISAVAEWLAGGGAEALGRIAVEIIGGIGAALFAAAPDLIWSTVEIGGAILEGLLSGIVDGLKNIGSWLKENLVDPIVDGVKNLFGIHSPSAVFADIGTNIISGMLEGISTSWGNITSFFSEKLVALTTTISTTWDTIKTKASEAWTNIKDTISTVGDEVKTVVETMATDTATKVGEWRDNLVEGVSGLRDSIGEKISELGSSITKKFTELKDGALTWGKDLIDNFVNGIKSGVNKVKKTVSDVAQSVKDFIGFSKPKSGPLSDFDTYGPDMMDLYANGISRSASIVTSEVRSIAKSIQDAFSGATYESEVGATGNRDRAAPQVGANIVDSIEKKTAPRAGGPSGMDIADENIINALYAVGSMIVRALEDQDTGTYFDGKAMARNLYPYMQQVQREKGAGLVNRGN